jgi:hypothetical protein
MTNVLVTPKSYQHWTRHFPGLIKVTSRNFENLASECLRPIPLKKII